MIARLLSCLAALAALALVTCAAAVSAQVLNAAWRLVHADPGLACDLPRPAPLDQLTATAINDRCVGGMRCHGSIVPLRAAMLVG